MQASQPLTLDPRSLHHQPMPDTSSTTPTNFPPSTSPIPITTTPISIPSRSHTPLTPPPRLHHRPLLDIPTPPLTLTHPPPPHPSPWIWKCHLCHTIYRLGVTRRCLEDGHFFCVEPIFSPPPPPLDITDTNTKENKDVGNVDGGGEDKNTIDVNRNHKRKQEKKRKKKKRNKGVSCESSFHYIGWNKFGFWKREIRFNMQRELETRDFFEEGRFSFREKGLRERERIKIENVGLRIPMVDVPGLRGGGYRVGGRGGMEGEKGKQKERNCWQNCNFPSECAEEKRAREWRMRMQVFEEEWGLSEGSGGSSGGVGVCDVPDEEGELGILRLVNGREEDDEHGDMGVYGGVGIGGGTGDLGDGIGERRRESIEAAMALGELSGSVAEMGGGGEGEVVAEGIDPDGLGEVFDIKKLEKRRKSIEDLYADKEPDSPLKTCISFDFEGGDDGNGNGNGEEEVDLGKLIEEEVE